MKENNLTFGDQVLKELVDERTEIENVLIDMKFRLYQESLYYFLEDRLPRKVFEKLDKNDLLVDSGKEVVINDLIEKVSGDTLVDFLLTEQESFKDIDPDFDIKNFLIRKEGIGKRDPERLKTLMSGQDARIIIINDWLKLKRK